MNVSTFTNDHLKNMLNTIHHENKSTLLTGDFKVNLISYNEKRGTYNFLELLFNYNFTTQITLPARVTLAPLQGKKKKLRLSPGLQKA